MKKSAFKIVVLVIIMLFYSVCAYAVTSVPDIVMQGIKSVVRIEAEFNHELSTGSGFVVGEDKDSIYVATNWHVVEGDPTSVYIWVDKDETADAEIYAYSIQRDLCILKLDSSIKLNPVCLNPTAEKGSAVYAVGFPSAGDVLSDTAAHTSDETTITDGIISAVRKATIVENGDPVKLLQISAAINSGNSGGPLFNSDGEVIGINTYSIYDSQGVFGAISSEELIDFLGDNGITPQFSNSRSPIMYIIVGSGAVIILASILFLVIVLCKKSKNRKGNLHNYDTTNREMVSDSQRFFDIDYGYSADNPFVVSSIRMEGCYLKAFRTLENEPFTWERQPHITGLNVDCYKVFVNGVFYREVFFNPNGYNSTQMPDGIMLDRDAFEAAQQGISVEQLHENNVTEQRITRQKKKRRSVVLKSLVAALLIICLVVAGYFAYPYIKYSVAEQKLKNGDWKQAEELFIQLRGYKDSEEKILYAQYQIAVQLRNIGDYEAAITAFESLENYSDATEQIKETYYVRAQDIFATGDYEAAKQQFLNLQDYKDSAEMLSRCDYQVALLEMEAERYQSAINKLMKIRSFEGSIDRLAECHYALMLQCIDQQKWGEAYEHYEEIELYDVNQVTDYQTHKYNVFIAYATQKISFESIMHLDQAISMLDELSLDYNTGELTALKANAQQQLTESKYERGMFLFNSETYSDAAEYFGQITEYKDSRAMWLESMYQYLYKIHQETNVNNGRLGEILYYVFLLEIRENKENICFYGETLSSENYKNSKQIYDKILTTYGDYLK